MARRSPVVIGTSSQPTTIDGTPVIERYGSPDVVLFSKDPDIIVTARMRGPATSPLPRPQIATTQRYGQVGITEWTGRDPFQMTLPVMFGAPGATGSIEKQIGALEALALRHAGKDEPPIVRVTGPVSLPRHGIEWRVMTLDEIPDRLTYNQDGARCCVAVDVTLIERVTADLLTETLQTGKAAKGTSHRRIFVHQGETDLYDVARRVYGDPSRAADIARANSDRKGRPLRLGAHVVPGQSLAAP